MPQVAKDQQALLVIKVFKEQQDLQVQQVVLVAKVLKVIRDLLVLLEYKDNLVPVVFKVLLENKVMLEQQV